MTAFLLLQENIRLTLATIVEYAVFLGSVPALGAPP